MLRTGIYKLDQLKSGKLRDIFGRDKNISLALYHTIRKTYTENDKDAMAEIVLNRFNSSRNAIKRTYKNRFNNFDDATIGAIKNEAYASVKLHDLAISDGRASLYFIDRLKGTVEDFVYHASDIAVSYDLYSEKEGSEDYVITDSDKTIIEITRPPFVWNYARPEGNFYFLNNYMKGRAGQKYASALKNKLLTKRDEIVLLDSDFVKATGADQRFKVINHNLFRACTETYNVIRVMNILHYGYFTAPELNQILSNIYNSLSLNGLFIEGSNEDPGSPVEGAVYKKTGKGFELLSSPEKPSRIQSLVVGFKPSNSR